jgi:hypothetical protein
MPSEQSNAVFAEIKAIWDSPERFKAFFGEIEAHFVAPTTF